MHRDDLWWWGILIWFAVSSVIDVIDVVTIDTKDGQVSVVRKKDESDKPKKKEVDSNDIKTDW